MGWSSANAIFDTMALKTQELGIPEPQRIEILATLVELLQDQDWDTEDESLADGLGDAAVVEAFRRRGIETQDWMTDDAGGEEPDEDPPYTDPEEE
jgi:hypothetical protein